MTVSTNMKRIQKTKDLDYPVEVELETGGKRGVYSDLSAMSNLKTKSRCNTGNLLEKVVDKRNIFEAYKKVVANKGSSGIDGMRVDELLTYLKENYETLKANLLNGKYKVQPVKRVEIPKPTGGVRLLGIPTVVDRLIQQAINQVINPIFDREFSNSSYGFRPRRSAHMALKQAQKYINEGYNLKDQIVKLLRAELEYVEGSHKDGTYYSQWVMAVSIKEVSKASYLARTVIKTNQSPYVDGTDITVNIIDGQAELDLSFAEEEPIFHGGEIVASIRWIENVNNFCYIQPEDPFAMESYKDRLISAIDGYSFMDLGDYNSFDSHVRNIMNLYKALLLDTLLVDDISVDGMEISPGQYKLKVIANDKEFTLYANNNNIKADIVEEIRVKIILPIIEAENPKDEKVY